MFIFYDFPKFHNYSKCYEREKCFVFKNSYRLYTLWCESNKYFHLEIEKIIEVTWNFYM